MKNILLCCKPNALLASLSAAGLGYFMVRGFLTINVKEPTALDIVQMILKGSYQVYTAGIILIAFKGWYVYISTQAVAAVQYLMRPESTIAMFIAAFPHFINNVRTVIGNLQFQIDPRYRAQYRERFRGASGPSDNRPTPKPEEKAEPIPKPPGIKKKGKGKDYFQFSDLNPKQGIGIYGQEIREPEMEVSPLSQGSEMLGQGEFVPPPIITEDEKAETEESNINTSSIRIETSGGNISSTKTETTEGYKPEAINKEKIEKERAEEKSRKERVIENIIQLNSLRLSNPTEIQNVLQNRMTRLETEFSTYQNRIAPIEGLTQGDLELVHFLQYHGSVIIHLNEDNYTFQLGDETVKMTRELFFQLLAKGEIDIIVKYLDYIRKELRSVGLEDSNFGRYYMGRYDGYIRTYFTSIADQERVPEPQIILDNIDTIAGRIHELFRPESVRSIDGIYVVDPSDEVYDILKNIDFNSESISNFLKDPTMNQIRIQILEKRNSEIQLRAEAIERELAQKRFDIEQQQIDIEQRAIQVENLRRQILEEEKRQFWEDIFKKEAEERERRRNQEQLYIASVRQRLAEFRNTLISDLGWEEKGSGYIKKYNSRVLGELDRPAGLRKGTGDTYYINSGSWYIDHIIKILEKRFEMGTNDNNEINFILSLFGKIQDFLEKIDEAKSRSDQPITGQKAGYIKAAISDVLRRIFERLEGDITNNNSYNQANKDLAAIIEKNKDI